MNYKAENVDTNKALDYIGYCRKIQTRQEQIEIIKVQKFHEGVRKGLDIAQGIFECSNYEKQAIPASYEDCAKKAIYEIAKELDIQSQDIRDSGKCADFAARIQEHFKEYYTE